MWPSEPVVEVVTESAGWAISGMFSAPSFRASRDGVVGELGNQDFLFGLDLILDGVAATIDVRPGGRPGAT